METKRQKEIFGIILENEPIGISRIAEKMAVAVSLATINRDLAKLKAGAVILSEGSGPGVKYKVNLRGLLLADIDADAFFKTDIDDRQIIERYNPFIFEQLNQVALFSKKELSLLNKFSGVYQQKIMKTEVSDINREFERLMIELAWKSSQLEGNTYDLLDTEQLLKYNIEATGHSAEEAMMLLNHKAVIEYTREYADMFAVLTVGNIIDIHALLVKDMDISKTIRKRIVRITGTKYRPPDNEFIIEEALEKLCILVNEKKDYYEKALLVLLLISYIQPFDDGNKRTARLMANAVLMSARLCPLSYRSVSPATYKKSVLLFYELNNINAFKKIFITQYQFAVENYF
ncbi:hypothetical protein BH10BAC3_BH10BAC3_12310 [soil metagenome]